MNPWISPPHFHRIGFPLLGFFPPSPPKEWNLPQTPSLNFLNFLSWPFFHFHFLRKKSKWAAAKICCPFLLQPHLCQKIPMLISSHPIQGHLKKNKLIDPISSPQFHLMSPDQLLIDEMGKQRGNSCSFLPFFRLFHRMLPAVLVAPPIFPTFSQHWHNRLWHETGWRFFDLTFSGSINIWFWTLWPEMNWMKRKKKW